jgi:hypothetical protein
MKFQRRFISCIGYITSNDNCEYGRKEVPISYEVSNAPYLEEMEKSRVIIIGVWVENRTRHLLIYEARRRSSKSMNIYPRQND